MLKSSASSCGPTVSSPERWAIAAFIVTLPLLGIALRVGRRTGLLDHPSAIKPHARAVPYTGGAAVVATALALGVPAGVPPAVLVGLVLMWVVGFVDDARGLPAVAKLGAELPALAVPTLALGFELPRAIAYIGLGLVLVNAFNVVDGLDGLAAGVALPAFIVLAVAPAWGGPLAAVAAGSVCAFLTLNLAPARIFLGDEGSLVLGELLWLVPMAFLRPDAPVPGLVWALLWMFPLLNAGFVIAVRLRGGRSVLRGDRAHLYDMLHRRFGLTRTLVIAWSIAALGALGALIVG